MSLPVCPECDGSGIDPPYDPDDGMNGDMPCPACGGSGVDRQEVRRLITEETFPYELNPEFEVVTNATVVEFALAVLDKEGNP